MDASTRNLLIAVQFCFGVFPVLGKQAMEVFEPRAVLVWRLLVGAGVLALVAWRLHPRRFWLPRRDLAVVFGGLALMTAPTPGELIAPMASLPWWGFTLALTVLCTLGAFLLMNRWQPVISSTEAGLLYCIEPVFSSVASWFLPGLFSVWAAIEYANEGLSTHLLWGGGLILAANVLLQLRPTAKPSEL